MRQDEELGRLFADAFEESAGHGCWLLPTIIPSSRREGGHGREGRAAIRPATRVGGFLPTDPDAS
jgi:hypothetical protein